jgi:hypothetical protein
MSKSWLAAPAWGRLPACAAAVVCALVLGVSAASAQPKDKAEPKPSEAKTETKSTGDKTKKAGAPKTFDFTALDLNGRMRSPQLLYFLERANEELERASLEKRSFIPHMVRSLEEEQL